MPEDTKETKKVNRFVNSELLKNYAGAIAILLGALPAVGSLVVSVMTAYRGEPVAEKTWSTVRHQLNQQAAAINRLHLRVIHFQGHEEGRTAAAVQLKLDELQKKYDQLVARNEAAKVSATLPSSEECRAGHVRINDRCRPVTKAVAARIKEGEQQTAAVEKKLLEEKIRRLREEKMRKAAEKKVKAVQTTKPVLEMLPAKLDDAAKEK